MLIAQRIKNALLILLGVLAVVFLIFQKVNVNFPSPDNLTLEMSIFSGMPDPRCVLTKAEANSLLESIAASRKVFYGSPKDDLGYRGIYIIAQDEEQPRFFISNGMIFDQKYPGVIYLDKDRLIEKNAVSLFETCYDPEYFKQIRDMILL